MNVEKKVISKKTNYTFPSGKCNCGIAVAENIHDDNEIWTTSSSMFASRRRELEEESERKTDKDTGRDSETDRETQRHRQRERKTDRQTQRDKTNRQRETIGSGFYTIFPGRLRELS